MAVVASATGAAVFGLSGVAAGLAGGALLGAGAGALYSGITGDGDILNSALTGALLGGAAGGLGAAYAAPAAGSTVAPLTGTGALAPGAASTVSTATPALTTAQMSGMSASQIAGMTPAQLNAVAAAQGVLPEGAAALTGMGLTAAPATITPQIMAGTGAAGGIPSVASKMTGGQMLATGLAGTTALSLLGNRKGAGVVAPGTPSYIRPYTYSSTPVPAGDDYPSPYPSTPLYNAQGNPILDTRERNYFDQTFTAGEPYKAANGGLMAAGGPVERMSMMNTAINPQGGMYPQGLVDKTQYAIPTQRPTSMEVLNSIPQRMFARGGQVKGYALGGMPGSYEEYLAQSGGKMTQEVKPWQQGQYAGMDSKAAYESYVRSPEAQPTNNLPSNTTANPGVTGLGGLANNMPRFSGISFQESNFGKNTNSYPGTNSTGTNAGSVDGRYEVRRLRSGGKTEDDNEEESYKDRMKRIKNMTNMLREVEETGRVAPPDLGEYVPTMKEYKPSKLNVMAVPQAFVDAPQTKGIMGRVGGAYALDRDTQLLGGLSGFAGRDRGALTVRPSTADVGIARRMGPGMLAAQYERSLTGQQPPRYMANYSIPMAEGGITYDAATQTYAGLPTRGGAPAGDSTPLSAELIAQLTPQYQAANPNRFAYDPAQQRYSAATPTMAQLNAYKAEQDRIAAEQAAQQMDPFMQLNPFSHIDQFNSQFAAGGNVQGYNLGGYSDGGRLLKGPGDGVSDDIPAVIGDRQPARLADGEFVIPARIVSELGNGSTDAGAKRLYAMMDRIQSGRKKTIGKGNVAKDTKAKKHLLA